MEFILAILTLLLLNDFLRHFSDIEDIIRKQNLQKLTISTQVTSS